MSLNQNDAAPMTTCISNVMWSIGTFQFDMPAPEHSQHRRHSS